MALFEIAQRSYVMKELMSVGWESQEKDKNMVEVIKSTSFGSECLLQVNILSSCNHVNIIR